MQHPAPHLTLTNFDGVASYPPLVPHSYVVRSGDTFEKIAQQFYSNSREAERIAAYNGYSVSEGLLAGQEIRLPPPSWLSNEGDYHTPTARMLSVILSGVYPKIKPKSAHLTLGNVLESIVDYVAGALAFTFLGPAAAAVAAGLADLVFQTAAVAVGDREGIDLRHSILVAAETGLGYAILPANVNRELVEGLLRTGGLAAANQLLELSLGIRKQFNINELLETVAVAAAMQKIGPREQAALNKLGIRDPLLMNMLLDQTRGLLSAEVSHLVDGTHVNVWSVAAQSLGVTAQTALGEMAVSWAHARAERYMLEQERNRRYGIAHHQQGFFAQTEARKRQQQMANDYGQGNTQPTSKTVRHEATRELETWQQRALYYGEAMMEESLPYTASVEDWQRPTGIQLREGSREMLEASLASNPHLTRVVGPSGQTSYVDKNRNVYYATDRGIVRQSDPPVQSFHLIEDIMLGGAELGAVKLLGKGIVKIAPGVAEVGAEVIAGAKGLAGGALSKLVAGFGVLGAKDNRDRGVTRTKSTIITARFLFK